MKIFLTVGSMLPFDRLVSAMDHWAATHRDHQIFGQIGESQLRPAHIDYRKFISPGQFREHFVSSDFIVSHVGMGTVITATECRRPLLMLPRRADLSEVTSNHQLATARWLIGQPGIKIVQSEGELEQALDDMQTSQDVLTIETGTRDMLIQALQKFIAA